MTSVYLKPYYINDMEKALVDSSFNVDRNIILAHMKKIAARSSENLRRNADAFLSTQKQDNETLIWAGSKRIPKNKFKLSY